jgi:hypothetical protein
MRTLRAILGVLLVLGAAGCAAPPPKAGGDACACCAKKETSKPMTCNQKEHSGGCCTKGDAKAPAEGHQH